MSDSPATSGAYKFNLKENKNMEAINSRAGPSLMSRFLAYLDVSQVLFFTLLCYYME